MSHRGLEASPIMLRERVLRKDTDGVLRTVQKQLSIGQGIMTLTGKGSLSSDWWSSRSASEKSAFVLHDPLDGTLHEFPLTAELPLFLDVGAVSLDGLHA